MARNVIEILLEARNNASGKFKQASQDMKTMNMEMNKVTRGASAFDRMYTAMGRGLSSVHAGIGRFNQGIHNLNKGLRTYNQHMANFNRVTNYAMIGAGFAIYKFTRDSIRNFMELEKQHSKTMGAISANYNLGDITSTNRTQTQKDNYVKFQRDSNALRSQAIQFGAKGFDGKGSLVSAQDISSMQTAMIKAGIPVKDILKTDALRSVVQFAGGNDLSADKAVEYAVNLAQTFNIPRKKWGTMLDKVTRTADLSVVDVPDLMQSLKHIGPVAAGSGRPLEEILGMLAVMGNSGLKGSMAGTGIRAIMTKMLSPIGNSKEAISESAPTKNVETKFLKFMDNILIGGGKNYFGYKSVSNAMRDFSKDAGKQKLAGMPKVIGELDRLMDDLDDKEKAWFGHKMFGLFQMKAAYALNGPDGSKNGGRILADTINNINRTSGNVNANKWNIMKDSSYGRSLIMKNAWAGMQAGFGEDLSPFVDSINDELFKAISDPKNYQIDWTNIQEGLKKATKKIEKNYGKSIADLVKNVGDFGIKGVRTGSAVAPTLTGFGGGLVKLLSFDIPGALKSFKKGINETDKNIEKLPPELQDAAKGLKNLVIVVSSIWALGKLAKLVEWVTTIYDSTLGKLGKKKMKDALESTRSTMTVKANVVNVYGKIVNVYGKGGTPGKPGTPGTPQGQLPGRGPQGQLPSGSPTLQLPGRIPQGQLPSGRLPQGQLPSGGKPPLQLGRGNPGANLPDLHIPTYDIPGGGKGIPPRGIPRGTPRGQLPGSDGRVIKLDPSQWTTTVGGGGLASQLLRYGKLAGLAGGIGMWMTASASDPHTVERQMMKSNASNVALDNVFGAGYIKRLRKNMPWFTWGGSEAWMGKQLLKQYAPGFSGSFADLDDGLSEAYYKKYKSYDLRGMTEAQYNYAKNEAAYAYIKSGANPEDYQSMIDMFFLRLKTFMDSDDIKKSKKRQRGSIFDNDNSPIANILNNRWLDSSWMSKNMPSSVNPTSPLNNNFQVKVGVSAPIVNVNVDKDGKTKTSILNNGGSTLLSDYSVFSSRNSDSQKDSPLIIDNNKDKESTWSMSDYINRETAWSNPLK